MVFENAFNQIHRSLTAAYGSEVLSIQAVRKWCNQFKNEWTSVFNEQRTGQSVSVSTDELWKKINTAIQKNCNVRLSLLVDQFGVVFGTVQRAVTVEKFVQEGYWGHSLLIRKNQVTDRWSLMSCALLRTEKNLGSHNVKNKAPKHSYIEKLDATRWKYYIFTGDQR